VIKIVSVRSKLKSETVDSVNVLCTDDWHLQTERNRKGTRVIGGTAVAFWLP